jgi:hypothetical protein
VLLGGKDNFAADRAAAEHVLAHARALLTSDPHSALILRTKAEVTAMFNSLELVPPGVAQLDRWLPRRPRPRHRRRRHHRLRRAPPQTLAIPPRPQPLRSAHGARPKGPFNHTEKYTLMKYFAVLFASRIPIR